LLDDSVIRRLSALADGRGTTLEHALLAAFQLLLSRYSGQRDLLTGYGVANRALPESRGLVGRLGNTVIVRTNLDDDPSFLELLERVRTGCFAAARHEDVPFALVEKALAPETSSGSLFQARFQFRNSSAPRPGAVLSTWTPLALPTTAVETEIGLAVEQGDRGLSARLEYSTDLFEPETAERMARNYARLLAAAVNRPDSPVSELALIHADEQRALRLLNATEAPVPEARGFHAMIAAQAGRTPERVAVIWGENELTYGELERSANQLANLLVERGVKRGMRIGIAVGRNQLLLMATLAVAKAGAAYVPLDPEYPSERLAYMIDDATIPLILSESAVRARLPEGSFQTILLDQEADALGARSERPPEVGNEPSDVGYVIYTSGSTGRPKGVQVPQGAIVNFLASMASVPGCTEDDRLIAVTTLSFDIAVLELFLPLTVGARTIVASRECLVDGERLAALIERHDATIMQATPVTWQLLLDAGWAGRPDSFKALCGGEAFPRRLAQRLIPRCASVWNMYGPTETTVWSTCQRLTNPEAPILVGKPIANTETYVLDAGRRVAPFGVAGELYIGGLGVTHGYLERPELTAERFVEDTFSGRPGARLYRTGDLARQWPHGLELIGRADNQVKLRGHRIELGEIEALLESDTEVSRAAVVVREFGAGDSRLVAYVTRSGDEPVGEARLRAALGARLPGYMVPGHFVELPRMPLTPNGKIDRKALPMPDTLASAPTVRAREQPVNAIEELLLTVWQRLLRFDEIGVTDDFFDLGGHSLLALKLLQGINETCKLELPLSFVFEARTIRKQAESINAGQRASGPTVVPLQTGAESPLFCICGISLYQTLARRLGPDRPVYGIFAPAEQTMLEDGHVRFGVRELAAEYVRAIVETHPRGPYYLAGVSFGGSLAYEVAQQLRAAGRDVGFVAILDVVVEPEAASSQRAWTTDRIVRVVERGPRYWLEKAREIARRAVDSAQHEAREARELVRRKLLVRLPEEWLKHLPGFAASGAPSSTDPADELARLHDLRDRHYDRAWREYREQLEPFDGTVVVVRARDEQRDELVGDDCGWSRYVASDKLHCHTIPGDHLGILQEPNVALLADALRGYFADRAAPASQRNSHSAHLAAE
jgi:amino acid adenylation domain-containing protein